jgi:hypothetical protein
MRTPILAETVTIHIELIGRIVGRTFHQRPTHDIATCDGAVWHSIPEDWIKETVETHAYRRGGVEPPLDEVLHDPLVHLVMASDRVQPDDLWRVIVAARRGLCTAAERAPSRWPDPACDPRPSSLPQGGEP